MQTALGILWQNDPLIRCDSPAESGFSEIVTCSIMSAILIRLLAIGSGDPGTQLADGVAGFRVEHSQTDSSGGGCQCLLVLD